MAKWMLVDGGRCRGGHVENCWPGKVHYQPDPQNAPPTDEELEAATARINAILESLTSPPGDPERDTLVFVADQGRLRLVWVGLELDEQDPTAIDQS
jgi:hypothetical protein